MRQRMHFHGLGDGFVSTSNYWQQLANSKVQYVLTPALPSPRLVPRTSLRGWLGAVQNPEMSFPSSDTYVGDDGCVYDTDGIRLTCPGGIAPSPGGVNRLTLPQSPTMNSNQTGNIVLPLTTPIPPQTPQPGVWEQFVSFLNSPLYAGSAIKTGYAVAGAALLLSGVLFKPRR